MKRIILGAVMAVLAMAQGASAADLPNETITVAKIGGNELHRAYVFDANINDMVDTKAYVFDGDTLKTLGMLSTGTGGLLGLSRDHKTGYVAVLYYDHLSHGNRIDVVESYDLATLALTGEIALPKKHAEASSYPGLVTTSFDDKYLFVQNVTPASSLDFIDLTTNKFVAELGTAGCYSAWPAPAQANKVSSVCGDGTILTLTFDPATGKVLTSNRSEKVFDPETDPMFTAAAEADGKLVFITYHGMVHVVDVSGDVAKAEPGWSVLGTAANATSWRPTGLQMLTYQKKTGRLFVSMYKNGFDGSHKNGADEIWAVDLAKKKVVQRVLAFGAVGLAVTQDDDAQLYLATEKGDLIVYHASGPLSFAYRKDGIAKNPTEVLAP